MKDVYIIIAHDGDDHSDIITVFFSEQRASEYCLYLNARVNGVEYGYRRVSVADSNLYTP